MLGTAQKHQLLRASMEVYLFDTQKLSVGLKRPPFPDETVSWFLIGDKHLYWETKSLPTVFAPAIHSLEAPAAFSPFFLIGQKRCLD